MKLKDKFIKAIKYQMVFNAKSEEKIISEIAENCILIANKHYFENNMNAFEYLKKYYCGINISSEQKIILTTDQLVGIMNDFKNKNEEIKRKTTQKGKKKS